MNIAEILRDATRVDDLAGDVIEQLLLPQRDQEVSAHLFGILTMRIAAMITEDSEEFHVMVELFKEGIDLAVYG